MWRCLPVKLASISKYKPNNEKQPCPTFHENIFTIITCSNKAVLCISRHMTASTKTQKTTVLMIYLWFLPFFKLFSPRFVVRNLISSTTVENKSNLRLNSYSVLRRTPTNTSGLFSTSFLLIVSYLTPEKSHSFSETCWHQEKKNCMFYIHV